MSDSERELEDPTVQALAGTIRALKGHLSRKINSAKKAIEDAGSRPSSRSLQELVLYQERIQAQFERIEHAYTKIMEMDQACFEEYEKELDDEAKCTDEAISTLRRFLASAELTEPTPPSSAAPAGTREAKVKPNKADGTSPNF